MKASHEHIASPAKNTSNKETVVTVIHTCIDISLQQFPAGRAQTRLAIGVSSVYPRFALWAGVGCLAGLLQARTQLDQCAFTFGDNLYDSHHSVRLADEVHQRGRERELWAGVVGVRGRQLDDHHRNPDPHPDTAHESHAPGRAARGGSLHRSIDRSPASGLLD